MDPSSKFYLLTQLKPNIITVKYHHYKSCKRKKNIKNKNTPITMRETLYACAIQRYSHAIQKKKKQ